MRIFKAKEKWIKTHTLNKSRKMSALKADVMNKNLFRALRSEAKFIFDRFLISHGFSTSRNKWTFNSNLEKYTAHLLQDLKPSGMDGKLSNFYFQIIHKINHEFREFQNRHFSKNVRSVS